MLHANQKGVLPNRSLLELCCQAERPFIILSAGNHPHSTLGGSVFEFKYTHWPLISSINQRGFTFPFTKQNSLPVGRYVAPEVFRNEEYDTKVDVFSFSLILQEMIEGFPPFATKQDVDVSKAYASKERPPFRAPLKLYSHGLKELIEHCWSENPADRPTFRYIIDELTFIQNQIAHKKRWTVRPLKCFQNLEAMWKRDSSRSSRSTSSSHSTRDFHG